MAARQEKEHAGECQGASQTKFSFRSFLEHESRFRSTFSSRILRLPSGRYNEFVPDQQ
jgi:hypothetical protein